MATYHKSSTIPVTPEALFAWHERPGAFLRYSPPWQRMEVVKPIERLENGATMVFRVKVAGTWMDWEVLHGGFVPGVQFFDEQVRGPFKRWKHLHRIEPASGGALLVDDLDYELPGGAIGRAFAGSHSTRTIERLFNYRHQRAAWDVPAHERLGTGPMTVAITGSSGLVGTQLAAYLAGAGHRVLRFVRRSRDSMAGGVVESGGGGAGPLRGLVAGDIGWDPRSGWVEDGGLEGVDAVVHLAGAGVADARWTPERKHEILSSRELGTRALVDAIGASTNGPRVLVSGSAIGYYGRLESQWVDEGTPKGSGFLADVVDVWEKEARRAEAFGVRVAMMRFGIILSARGGALAKMLPPFRAGAGGRLGSGQQYMSWVGLDDVLSSIEWALAKGRGVINVVGPNPVTQAEFAATLGRVLSRPAVFPTPASAVKALLGEMGENLLLGGARVRPGLLLEGGYEFHHPTAEAALRFELGLSAIHQYGSID